MKTLTASLVLVLTLFVALLVAGENENSNRIVLKDASNRVMGYIDGGSGKVAVKDKNNKLLGYVDSSNTWTKSNRKLANSRLPGLLFCGR